MAQAFDASTGFASSAGTHTFSHTCTGTDGLLFVGVMCQGGDKVTGATYNGVAMTLVGKLTLPSDDVGWTEMYLFVLHNPATGAHNVVVSMSDASSCAARSISFSGAKQSSTVDSSNTATANGSSITPATTVVGANAWLVGVFRDDVDTLVPGTGTTGRSAASSFHMGDSNGTVGTGSQALQMTWTGTGDAGAIIASFLPPPAAAGSGLMFGIF